MEAMTDGERTDSRAGTQGRRDRTLPFPGALRLGERTPRTLLAATLLAAAALAGACKRGTDAAEARSGPACDPTSPATLMECVSREAYERDLAFVAAPRPPGSPHHRAVQDLCAERFAAAGFEVERQAYGTGVNVIGTRAGASAEQVVISAHYDHIEECAGADDNGTGVAGLLETARVLAAGSWRRTLVVACWDEEEDGLVGAKAWAQRAAERGETIAASVVYEMIGFASGKPDSQRLPPGFDLLFPKEAAWLAEHEGRGDFVAVISRESSREAGEALARWGARVELPLAVVELPEVLADEPMVRDVYRSDHAAFWEAGFPAVMLTDTSEFRYDRYHCAAGPDVPEVLDAGFATRVVRATVAAAAELLGDGGGRGP